MKKRPILNKFEQLWSNFYKFDVIYATLMNFDKFEANFVKSGPF